MKFLVDKALKIKILNTLHYSWGFMVAFTKEKYILKANAFPINTIAIKRRILCANIELFFHYLFITILFITCLKVFIIIDFFMF